MHRGRDAGPRSVREATYRIPARGSMELFLTSHGARRFLRRSETVGHGEPLPDRRSGALPRGGHRQPRLDRRLRRRARSGTPCRRTIREAARALGILPASILPLYEARGRGEVSGFTVPAINIRMLTYDTARAAFRAAQSHRRGRAHLRDRAQRDRLHGPAPRRVRGGRPRRRDPRGLGRARLPPGRSLPDEPEEDEGGPRARRSARSRR